MKLASRTWLEGRALSSQVLVLPILYASFALALETTWFLAVGSMHYAVVLMAFGMVVKDRYRRTPHARDDGRRPGPGPADRPGGVRALPRGHDDLERTQEF